MKGLSESHNFSITYLARVSLIRNKSNTFDLIKQDPKHYYLNFLIVWMIRTM
jgi:hypothetical protein